MEINTMAMTASTPSSFGMPTRGHSRKTRCTGFANADVPTSVVWDRADAAKAGMGLAIAYVLGTSAWRPPSS